MNKEYFKILKEINSLESEIAKLEAENQEETYRVAKLKEREREALEEEQTLEGLLKQEKLEAQKSENLIVSLDAKIKKAASDLRSSFDSKHLEALEREIVKYESELELAQEHGLELLEKIEDLEAQVDEKRGFLKGIDETIREIAQEVAEISAKNQTQIDSKQKRIEIALEQIPPAFQSAYQSVKSKELAFSSFAKIENGRCSVCKSVVDRSKVEQVETHLAIKTCSLCGRIFIPNQALY